MPDTDVTLLLNQWANGDESALNALMPVLYRELHKIAKNFMSRQQPGHTLQTTAVVHEAYLKLAGSRDIEWRNRSHFFAVAAKAMRHILVDHARSLQANKRGGDAVLVPLEEGFVASGDPAADMLALDSALTALAKVDARKSQVLELRYFAGLSVEETAETLSVSPETVARDWKFARAFLGREMQRGS